MTDSSTKLLVLVVLLAALVHVEFVDRHIIHTVTSLDKQHRKGKDQTQAGSSKESSCHFDTGNKGSGESGYKELYLVNPNLICMISSQLLVLYRNTWYIHDILQLEAI